MGMNIYIHYLMGCLYGNEFSSITFSLKIFIISESTLQFTLSVSPSVCLSVRNAVGKM